MTVKISMIIPTADNLNAAVMKNIDCTTGCKNVELVKINGRYLHFLVDSLIMVLLNFSLPLILEKLPSELYSPYLSPLMNANARVTDAARKYLNETILKL